jgi:hypothetical protein
LKPLYYIRTEKLEQVFLFELFEDGGFNLDKLYRDEKSYKRIGVGVHGYVERDCLVEENERMDNCLGLGSVIGYEGGLTVVSHCQKKKSKRPPYFAAAIWAPVKNVS